MARRVCNLAAARNCTYIDAPVSGGVVAAKEHRLIFMVGARRKEHYEQALPFLKAIAAHTVRLYLVILMLEYTVRVWSFACIFVCLRVYPLMLRIFAYNS